MGYEKYLKDFWEYDVQTDSWKQLPDLPAVGRWGSVGFSINDKGYIGTGSNNDSIHLNDFWEFSPDNDSWKSIAALPQSTSFSNGFALNGKVYVVTDNFNVYEYDLNYNKWTTKNRKETVRNGLSAAFTIGAKGYVDQYEYDPVSDTWTEINTIADFSDLGIGAVNSAFILKDGNVEFYEFYPN